MAVAGRQHICCFFFCKNASSGNGFFLGEEKKLTVAEAIDCLESTRQKISYRMAFCRVLLHRSDSDRDAHTFFDEDDPEIENCSLCLFYLPWASRAFTRPRFRPYLERRLRLSSTGLEPILPRIIE